MTRTLWIALALASQAHADTWPYTVPKANDPFAHPPARALALSATRPADLKVTAKFRGPTQRYGRLTYGIGRTAPIAVVVDEVAPGDVDLYLDAGRSGEISTTSRCAGEKLTWRVALKSVVHVGDKVKEHPRTLQLRYNRISRTLAVATCGYVEGTVDLDGKQVRVRRTDGDANGLFADAQDRIWVDLDGNDAWDSAEEEFLFAPILRLGKRRFAVRADEFGKQLHFAPLVGEGTLQLALPATIKPASVREVAATFQSKDGCIATIRETGGKATVPIGEYHISSLTLTLADADGGQPWTYVFSSGNGRGPRWHTVGKDATVPLDAIGKLDFTLLMEKKCKAGMDLSVAPRLYTGEGLLIASVYRGASDRTDPVGCGAAITLTNAAGKVLATARSGFA